MIMVSIHNLSRFSSKSMSINSIQFVTHFLEVWADSERLVFHHFYSEYDNGINSQCDSVFFQIHVNQLNSACNKYFASMGWFRKIVFFTIFIKKMMLVSIHNATPFSSKSMSINSIQFVTHIFQVWADSERLVFFTICIQRMIMVSIDNATRFCSKSMSINSIHFVTHFLQVWADSKRLVFSPFLFREW